MALLTFMWCSGALFGFSFNNYLRKDRHCVELPAPHRSVHRP